MFRPPPCLHRLFGADFPRPFFDWSYFCVPWAVLYNLLLIRGDCHARLPFSPIPGF